ncbi:MAG: HD domain-containing protein [Clostridia bacterium]|nr:HD domain-containing protein [Clostridia bacterium]
MLDYKVAYEEFKKYIKNFDTKYGKNSLKIRHTYGVVNCSEYVSKDLKLSDEDIELSKIIALLHDLGRFEQIKKYDNFKDYVTVDHALIACRILFDENLIRKFIIDDKYDNIIFKAILNHNKYSIEENLNEIELLHTKILRDADKMDNFRVKSYDDFENIIDNSNREILENDVITDAIFNTFMNNKLILSKEKVTSLDSWISFIAFIFDFNFRSGFKYINNRDYINKIIDRLDYKKPETKEKMEKVRQHAIEYVKSKI